MKNFIRTIRNWAIKFFILFVIFISVCGKFLSKIGINTLEEAIIAFIIAYLILLILKNFILNCFNGSKKHRQNKPGSFIQGFGMLFISLVSFIVKLIIRLFTSPKLSFKSKLGDDLADMVDDIKESLFTLFCGR